MEKQYTMEKTSIYRIQNAYNKHRVQYKYPHITQKPFQVKFWHTPFCRVITKFINMITIRPWREKGKVQNNVFQEIQRLYQTLINRCKEKRHAGMRKAQINCHYYFSPKRNTRVVPYLALSGIWLTEAGFEIGDNLIIKVKKECLIIRKAPEYKFNKN